MMALLLPSILLVMAGGSRAASPLQAFRTHVSWDITEADEQWDRPIFGSDGTHRYTLALRPIRALEGGVMAVALALSPVSESKKNILEHARSGGCQPAIWAEEAPTPTEPKECRRTKAFRVGPPHSLVVRVANLTVGSRPGLGLCSNCPSISHLELDLALETDQATPTARRPTTR